jgi:predicted NAD/FAD-binding protein
MRIAVIGSGISGNLAARLLCRDNDVHLFEANDYLGGHSNTVDVDAFGQRWSVDTGFMVFNERTYPNFCRMLRLLHIEAQDSDMSFSVRCRRTGLEYQGSSLNGLFADRRNLLRPKFYGMLRDILRFNRESLAVLEQDQRMTLGEYLQRHRFGRQFVDKYLVPMGAAIWSAQPEKFLDFPVHFLVGFFRNHGLLQITDRPQWKTIAGGARRYVRQLVAPLRDRIRLGTPVERVVRYVDHVEITPRGGSPERFDQVVFATHADQTLAILSDADEFEREILSAFPYQENQAVLHTDASLLPTRRRAWASWNYDIPRDDHQLVSVTYDLSRLQRVDSPQPILLTLNGNEPIDPDKVLRTFTYAHPAYNHASIDAQRRQEEINGRRRTYFCGAYWGYGFHEDGVNSALAVGKHFGRKLDECTVASTKDASSTAATAR